MWHLPVKQSQFRWSRNSPNWKRKCYDSFQHLWFYSRRHWIIIEGERLYSTRWIKLCFWFASAQKMKSEIEFFPSVEMFWKLNFRMKWICGRLRIIFQKCYNEIGEMVYQCRRKLFKFYRIHKFGNLEFINSVRSILFFLEFLSMVRIGCSLSTSKLKGYWSEVRIHTYFQTYFFVLFWSGMETRTFL